MTPYPWCYHLGLTRIRPIQIKVEAEEMAVGVIQINDRDFEDGVEGAARPPWRIMLQILWMRAMASGHNISIVGKVSRVIVEILKAYAILPKCS